MEIIKLIVKYFTIIHFHDSVINIHHTYRYIPSEISGQPTQVTMHTGNWCIFAHISAV